ncbi:N-acetylglutamate synthase [Andreprevotia lacus DSM 23236]|jgi:amino-acid N-acetyltransferase|uniref:Amino-acid acetyltransferase n=1 Tax=Andreprevotia lacus DSM 23236 TaxID=1121001 RepID=A0A1W1XXT2_9NEIS|nr:amino-acid N-acetyltransferase [Andreprevotia lacus]SMC28664.1 N-acetylglutamate synthase [Andreprevotia lacus DSM 23236]
MHTADFVDWFRQAAPYIHAFRGRTFVIALGGEVVREGKFATLTHDINLLTSLGVRLVVVHGARPQIDARMAERGLVPEYHKGVRLTDLSTLECVIQAAGHVRVEIESWLSMGLANSPMANADIRVSAGNFITAQPMGVVDGIDLQYTGQVRKVDTTAINYRLDDGELVLLSTIGYSPTGEVFNITLEDVATSAAIALKADKLLFLFGHDGVIDREGQLLTELTAHEAQTFMDANPDANEDIRLYLPCAIRAVRQGVARAHLITHHVDGSLLMELFTRDGIGTMISREPLEALRQATIDDVGGMLALIEPLEEAGVLVKRGREQLEREISRYAVLEHDSKIIGCVALQPFASSGMAELACLVVDPDYRDEDRGAQLLRHIEQQARSMGLRQLFALTTRTSHWFVERGFAQATVDELPIEKKHLYNYQRRSKVFIKPL